MLIPAAPADHENEDKDSLRQIGRKVRKRLAANEAVRRIAVEDAELWTVSGFFDAFECGRLISMIDDVAKPSRVHHADYADGIRTSFSGDVDPHDPFVRTIQRRLDELVGIDPVNGETIQGQRYTEGQEFKPHIDWFPPRSAAWERERARGGQRTYTAMAFLNAVEEGGETDFPLLGIAVKPRPGMLLLWNNADENGVPNPWTFHAGNPVTRGVKYIITKWYRCRHGL